ncbi:hypothetical protein SAMN05216330_110124 [Bradyrhizobium sp. Ghvi]|uniref:hypothetical protein n=1 Tax=Bradyrhizobium sp. Ghvi TaxID=1855319 RepID=UPI0008EE660E|nr:hypothetical protein [Bradyrhizobium sp. Ghvi]SFP78960.1 hypothetical protein SAMN05216330_110124 [Bradyrhizobium sp. Ghvi]
MAIARVQDLASEITEHNTRMCEVLARAADVLKLPRPDTFLGRRTKEPFPAEEQPIWVPPLTSF